MTFLGITWLNPVNELLLTSPFNQTFLSKVKVEILVNPCRWVYNNLE